MLKITTGLAVAAVLAFAVSPASARGMDCSAKNTSAAVTGMTKMGDGPAKEKAQMHMVGMNSALAKGKMGECGKHLTAAMGAMK